MNISSARSCVCAYSSTKRKEPFLSKSWRHTSDIMGWGATEHGFRSPLVEVWETLRTQSHVSYILCSYISVFLRQYPGTAFQQHNVCWTAYVELRYCQVPGFFPNWGSLGSTWTTTLTQCQAVGSGGPIITDVGELAPVLLKPLPCIQAQWGDTP